MKDKQIRECLHHASEQQVEQIASRYPAANDQTKERIFREVQRRRLKDVQPHRVDMPAAHPNHVTWQRYAGMAAAIVCLVGGTAGLMAFLRHAPRNPQPDTSMTPMQTATQETEGMTETTPFPTAAPTEAEPLSKPMLYQRCTSSLQYLTQLAGHIEIWDVGFANVLAGDIRFDYDAARFYGTVQYTELATGRVVSSEERFVSDGHDVKFTDREEWDFTYGDGTPGHADPAKLCTYSGQMEVDRNQLHNDPTGSFHDLAQCFQPVDMTGGYLSNLNAWDITGTETYQGRECAVIEGTSDDYGRRFQTTHFQIKVDIATGVWLFYEGYGDDGAVHSYLYTSDMVFGDTSPVPGITEAEIDERIAQGYVIDEWSQKWREQNLAAQAATQLQTEPPTEPLPPYVEPDTMPEPFADGAMPDAFVHPCEPRFEEIPPELAALVPEDALQEWLAGCAVLTQEDVTSVMAYPNMATFVRDFGLDEGQVREALADYIAAWDPEISLRVDELDAILSANETAILQNMANWECIVVRDRVYTPKWMYAHGVQDYVNAGITPGQVAARRGYYDEFDLTPAARAAFDAKLDYYTTQCAAP